VGLGFPSLSTIDTFTNHNHSSAGRSLLFNLFHDNPDELNFIAVALQRSTQSNGEVQGSVSVGVDS
jgi:saccharopepsin